LDISHDMRSKGNVYESIMSPSFSRVWQASKNLEEERERESGGREVELRTYAVRKRPRYATIPLTANVLTVKLFSAPMGVG
jgi:hypothetical protein